MFLRNPYATPPGALLNVLLPEKSRVLSLAVSPDGHFIALVLVKDGLQQIWVRELDALELTSLEGTDGARNPFWSPDRRSIAFFADARLKKIDRSGGPVQTLCDALASNRGRMEPEWRHSDCRPRGDGTSLTQRGRCVAPSRKLGC